MSIKNNNLSTKFKPLSIEERKNINGAGIISTIVSKISDSINSLTSSADAISNTVIKNKIISKMDNVKKGEVELGKNGELRLKWDSITSNDDIEPIKTSVIF